jgi:hypothetical protein
MNFWRQTTHIMSYFKEENFRGERALPSSFMAGFLEVCSPSTLSTHPCSHTIRAATRQDYTHCITCI